MAISDIRSASIQIAARRAPERREMPRLQLTQPQATRLFGLESGVCERVLGKLVSEQVLTRDARGRYALREDG